MTFLLLLVCFFLSGFAALLYETAWSREFAFVFGTSELAVVAVLAAYMGGLALGAALAARWAPRVRRPVLWYGVLELAIALWALALPYAIRAVQVVYLQWLGGIEAIPETLGLATHAFHLVGAFVVLVPCTALMGATLPLLARHAITRADQIGPRIGLLYGANTAGAIGGTLAAGFVLLPALGLRHTVWVGAAVNGLVFLTAAALTGRSATARTPAPRAARGLPWILPVIAVSGAVSFGYEVLWFRMLGHVLGGSTAAFSTMLASFLAGIALGSAVASRWASSRSAAAVGFAVAQLGAALAARLGFAATGSLPEWATALGASVSALGPGAMLAMAVLMPLTLCVGATFPFAVRLLCRDAQEASESSARVFAWNTLGSIAGAVGTGYGLLPWLGLESTLMLGVALNLGLAAVASALSPPLRRYGLAAALAFALGAMAFPASRPDALIRASPIGESYAGELAYLGVGRSATVALVDAKTSWRLTTNGLPESLILRRDHPGSVVTTRWLSMLPVLARPETRHMLIIGLGGGLTLQSVPDSVETIEVIELEPEVVEANRAAVGRKGGNPLEDPRVVLRLSDARGALTLADRRYDAIVSQPSHPWTSGASHLYTREFFSLVRSRLDEDGVFVQWIGAAFADPQRLRALLAALNETFGYVELYQPFGPAIVMLASDSPFDIVASSSQALAVSPSHYVFEGIQSVEDVASALVLDARGTRELARGTPPNTDDRNVLATTGIAAAATADWTRPLFSPHDALPGLADRLDPALLARRLRGLGRVDRGARFADRLDPARRELVLGWMALEGQRARSALRHLGAALEADPGLSDAAIGLGLIDPSGAHRELVPERARTVLDAQVAWRDGWERVRAQEDELAAWKPGELLHPEASELRARWRSALGGPTELEEASAILQPLIAHRSLPRHVLLYARIAAQRGRNDVAWMALEALGDALSKHPDPGAARRALDFAAQIGDPPAPGILVGLRRAAGAAARERTGGGSG